MSMNNYTEVFALLASNFNPQAAATADFLETERRYDSGERDEDRYFETYYDACDYAAVVFAATAFRVEKEYVTDEIFEYMRRRGWIYSQDEVAEMVREATAA